VVSTASLLLDIVAVSEALVGDDQGELKAGKLAQMGAKLGRIVRVLRLVRILKLYKAIYEAHAARQKRLKARAAALEPGADPEDDWDDDEMADGAGPGEKETRIGKKLSEKTTRSVIMLVLCMLLGMNLLAPDGLNTTSSSAFYGADSVQISFEDYISGKDTRENYEHTLLEYIYFHSWFIGNSQCEENGPRQGCAHTYYQQMFWMGITGVDYDAAIVKNMTALAQIRSTAVKDFETNTVQRQSGFLFTYGSFPDEAQILIGTPWILECDITRGSGFDPWRGRGLSLLSQSSPEFDNRVVNCPVELRLTDRIKYIPQMMSATEHDEFHFVFYFDKRRVNQEEAMMNFFKTIFVCMMLFTAVIFFNRDANLLVLHPVEEMIRKVDVIRKNPLGATKMADDEFKKELRDKHRAGKENGSWQKMFMEMIKCESSSKNQQEPMETVILEKTIIKLGTLLALGFGEAGANIIGQNMRGLDTAGVNAMIPGSHVECVIGYARIQNFSTATEVLQSKVMTYVNQISEIVHGVVDEYHGAPNKNNGDTFLLIWKTSDLLDEARIPKVADMAVLAFVKILGAINRCPLLAIYRGHPGLQQRLGTHTRVAMTFGLHYGWAIEGAVGSEFKIDASYLSPNVTIGTSIEAATSTYGVSILASEALADIVTAPMLVNFRQIDCVVITGCAAPMRLYSIDLDFMSLQVDEHHQRPHVWNARQRFRVRQQMEEEKIQKWDASSQQLFDGLEDGKTMRRRFNLRFLQYFNMGYQNYSQGEWEVARRLLSDTRTMLGCEDGPSAALLRFMESPYKFKAPAGWKGYHELGSVNCL